MKECGKSIARRLTRPNFINHYFVGHGVDIGGRPDPLSLYQTFFNQMKSVKVWDIEDGDAEKMASVENNHYDFVHSSHTLEHLINPLEGLKNWLRILRPNGYLIFTVPDEDMYEQGIFPSTFNSDHKWTFTILKHKSWSSKSINLIDIVRELGEEAELLSIEQINSMYRFDLPRFDQTLGPVTECCIEVIIRKRPANEISDFGRWRRSDVQPSPDLRIHFNQYQDDVKILKQNNNNTRPFTNDNNL